MNLTRCVENCIRRQTRTTGLRVPVMWMRHRSLTHADVFIASYPRSGSTWLRFLLYDVITKHNNEFRKLDTDIPYIGSHHDAPAFLQNAGRLIKTHEHYREEYRRAIYILRDPRDVLISNFFFYNKPALPGVGIHEFTARFLKGKVNPYGQWNKHVYGWLNSPLELGHQLLLLRYEDLYMNPQFEIARILNFLNIERDSTAIQAAIANNGIATMREKENRDRGCAEERSQWGRLVRRGQVGAWRELLDRSDLALVEELYSDALRHCGYVLSQAPDDSSFYTPFCMGILGS
jgi:hypothetical protein